MRNDKELREALIRREPEAIEQIMNAYAGLLWKAAQRVLHTSAAEEVEECVADVFFDLWQHPQAYDPQRSGLKTYLTQAARYKAIDRCRKAGRSEAYPLREEEARSGDVLDELTRRESAEELREAVQSLPEPDREIVSRRFYENQKPDEISAAMSLQTRQVNNRIYRAKQRLREWWTSRKGEERSR
ncbi:sigma-70 family RNA polymerase sigma factor [Saccharibacillus sp. CPCC 101409]|uniref:sigma-70 family RNA polymerase sigma factor n=1 Tax=Saccharibacillus sp. CPCC 101409 TaxID=3058041 RepID=UPI002673B95E|nr:sigma-70 family RNA polymerase sigma factor [Saccharibacillus sp. CPCC 101409]MDO3408151.1 sigma-70 family RNA polymerase sigma factor [Saccharibacillus sp. CPCC 101409]